VYNPREIDRVHLRLGAELGNGLFGTVLTAQFDDISRDAVYPVAVKIVNENAPDEVRAVE
jgi:hypothetical protein